MSKEFEIKESVSDQIKSSFEQQEMERYYESHACAESFDDDGVTWDVVRVYTEADKRISREARRKKDEANKELGRQFNDYVLNNKPFPVDQYAKAMQLVHIYADVVKKHGEW